MKAVCRQQDPAYKVRVRNVYIQMPSSCAVMITANVNSLAEWVNRRFPDISEDDWIAIERRVQFYHIRHCLSTNQEAINYWWSKNAAKFENVRPPFANHPAQPPAYHGPQIHPNYTHLAQPWMGQPNGGFYQQQQQQQDYQRPEEHPPGNPQGPQRGQRGPQGPQGNPQRPQANRAPRNKWNNNYCFKCTFMI